MKKIALCLAVISTSVFAAEHSFQPNGVVAGAEIGAKVQGFEQAFTLSKTTQKDVQLSVTSIGGIDVSNCKLSGTNSISSIERSDLKVTQLSCETSNGMKVAKVSGYATSNMISGIPLKCSIDKCSIQPQDLLIVVTDSADLKGLVLKTNSDKKPKLFY